MKMKNEENEVWLRFALPSDRSNQKKDILYEFNICITTYSPSHVILLTGSFKKYYYSTDLASALQNIHNEEAYVHTIRMNINM